jgi:DNA-binding protein YbaB
VDIGAFTGGDRATVSGDPAWIRGPDERRQPWRSLDTIGLTRSPERRFGVASEEFDFGLEQARQHMRDLVAASTGPDGEPLEGYGEAANGMVQVTVAGGRISAVELNPRVMRLPSEELAEAFVEAANAALADLAAKYPAVAAPPVDLAAVERQLAEAQEQSAMQLRRYEQTISEALAQLGR